MLKVKNKYLLNENTVISMIKIKYVILQDKK